MLATDYSLVLIGATALLVANDASPEQRQAAYDSLLYAQLAANKRVGTRFSDYGAWYGAYRTVYSELGWVIARRFHDSKDATELSGLAAEQPLQAWLDICGIDGARVVEAVGQGLRGSLEAQRHLRTYGQQDRDGGTCVVVEVGVLAANARLDLCSIALQTAQPLAQWSLEHLFETPQLQGEVHMMGISLGCIEQYFAPRRKDLRALMERKLQQERYVLELGACSKGDRDE